MIRYVLAAIAASSLIFAAVIDAQDPKAPPAKEAPANKDEPKPIKKDEPKKDKEKKKNPATEAEALKTLPDFKVELLQSSDAATQGSWIYMCKDNKGRLIVAGQRGQPILRFTIKDGKVDKIEKLNLPISEAMGLLYAFDSLYVNGAGPKGFGLYRCKRHQGADQYDDVQFLKKLDSRRRRTRTARRGARSRQKIYVIMRQSHEDAGGTCRRLAAQELSGRSVAAAPVGRQRPCGRHARSRRLCPAHRSPTASSGNWCSPASATPTTSPSMPTANCSPSTATWNGIGACRGIGRSASTMHERRRIRLAFRDRQMAGLLSRQPAGRGRRRHRLADGRRPTASAPNSPRNIRRRYYVLRLDLRPPARRPFDAQGIELHRHVREFRRPRRADGERGRRSH